MSAREAILNNLSTIFGKSLGGIRQALSSYPDGTIRRNLTELKKAGKVVQKGRNWYLGTDATATVTAAGYSTQG